MLQLLYIFDTSIIGVEKVKVNNINNVNSIVPYAVIVNNNKKNDSAKHYPQINELSNVCYKPLSFGRTKAEHKSWGAVIDPNTKEASFKILTYPDTKKVTVTVEKRSNRNNKKEYELTNQGKGVFATDKKIPAGEVENGDIYYYTIHKGNGDIDRVKDPYSFRQEKLLGESTIYDHSLYAWKDDNWYKYNKNRISRQANQKNGLTPVKAARIYEFNTATLTKKGTFEAAKAAIKTLPQQGFNAIEIMPVENTYSFNWGYDGVDKMAPSEHLGGPDGLKELIDYAHSVGLNVIMDMVPNHLGPDGASLLKTGPYIKGNNCFGEAFNFEGQNSEYVRDYIVNSALNWIENYHCDGLRLDMTKFMESDYTMKQIAAEVNYHHPEAFLIAEDGRNGVSTDDFGNYWANYDEPHDKRVVTTLQPYETGEHQSEEVHGQVIEDIIEGKTSIGRLGFDSEWDFNYFHTLKDGLYGNIDLDKYEKACYCSQDRVKYIMSHDEIGNFEGSRLIAKLLVPMLHLNDNITLSEDDINRAMELSKLKGQSIDDAKNTVRFQKAQFTSEKLAMMYQTGELDKYNTDEITDRRWLNIVNQAFRNEVLKPLGIKASSGLTYENVKNMYEKSIDKNKMALARTYSLPGPKMIFQGDERADLTPFRFFRQFDSVKDEYNLYVEKGYRTGKNALHESTLGNIKYSAKGRNTMVKFRQLTKDLNLLNSNNPALVSGKLIPENTVKHHSSQVFATHARDNESKNEIYSISNFSDMSYPRKDADRYYIKFPKGQWQEVINTDDKKYGGKGRTNPQIIYSDGYGNQPISLSGQSTAIFKRVG